MRHRPVISLAAGAILLLAACSSGAPAAAPSIETTAAPTVVGQANGFFPNQAPAIGQPAPKNNFGIQQVPGLNGR